MLGAWGRLAVGCGCAVTPLQQAAALAVWLPHWLHPTAAARPPSPSPTPQADERQRCVLPQPIQCGGKRVCECVLPLLLQVRCLLVLRVVGWSANPVVARCRLACQPVGWLSSAGQRASSLVGCSVKQAGAMPHWACAAVLLPLRRPGVALPPLPSCLQRVLLPCTHSQPLLFAQLAGTIAWLTWAALRRLLTG